MDVATNQDPIVNLSTIAGFLLISATVCNAEDLPGEPFDYNFDGHMDYRVLTVSDAKSSQFDVFIYDPALKKHVKDATLSGLVYPYPDPKTKRVFSIHTGGHSAHFSPGQPTRGMGRDLITRFL